MKKRITVYFPTSAQDAKMYDKSYSRAIPVNRNYNISNSENYFNVITM